MGEGGDPSAEQPPEPLSLADALAILTDDTRASILIELGKAWGEGGPASSAVSYSDLMARVGVEDSGRFNYHLEKLVGPFVKKGGDGYVLHHPGHLIYQALVAGTLTDRPTGEPVDIGPCPRCGGTMEARYRSDQLVVTRCGECDTTLDRIPFPPAAIDGRDTAELIDAAIQKQYHELSLFRRGVCYGCGGQVERQVETTPPDEWRLPFESDIYCLLGCTTCQAQLIADPAHVAITTPDVGAFFAEHGHDPALTRSWREVLVAAENGMWVASEEPLEVAVPFTLGDERLVVRLDEQLAVGETERGSA